MKKILLIEDRAKRQEVFMADADVGFDLAQYDDVIDNMTSTAYNEIYKLLKEDEYDFDYSVIITHRSAFGEDNSRILDKLREYCKVKSIKLVLFSGGITNTFYSNSPIDFLLVNSKTFYSKNLKLFLDNAREHQPNILILSYGEKWEMNILLNTLEKINLFIGNNIDEPKVELESFESDTKIALIKDIIDYQQPPSENGGVEMTTLQRLSTEVTNKIKQKIIFNV